MVRIVSLTPHFALGKAAISAASAPPSIDTRNIQSIFRGAGMTGPYRAKPIQKREPSAYCPSAPILFRFIR